MELLGRAGVLGFGEHEEKLGKEAEFLSSSHYHHHPVKQQLISDYCLPFHTTAVVWETWTFTDDPRPVLRCPSVNLNKVYLGICCFHHPQSYYCYTDEPTGAPSMGGWVCKWAAMEGAKLVKH